MPWCDLFKYEIKAIAGNKPLLITVFVGVIFYSFFIPTALSKPNTDQSSSDHCRYGQ
jgi:hypothetical protein